MTTTVNALCYKPKTLSNGEHPLMICVCKDGKRKYKSLGVSVKAEHWNFEKNLPKTNCPNKEYINILIANKRKEYETEIVKLKSEDKPFTANTLNDSISNSVKPEQWMKRLKNTFSYCKSRTRTRTKTSAEYLDIPELITRVKSLLSVIVLTKKITAKMKFLNYFKGFLFYYADLCHLQLIRLKY